MPLSTQSYPGCRSSVWKSPCAREQVYNNGLCHGTSFSAKTTNFSKVLYMVERSVGGACIKGRYLAVVTGTVLSDVMALKPLHAGWCVLPFLQTLPAPTPSLCPCPLL